MTKLCAMFLLAQTLAAFADTNNPEANRDRDPRDQGADWCPATEIPPLKCMKGKP